MPTVPAPTLANEQPEAVLEREMSGRYQPKLRRPDFVQVVTTGRGR